MHASFMKTNVKTERTRKMEEIVWIEKEKIGNPGRTCDVTVATHRDGNVRIVFRNGYADEIAPESFIRFGLSPNDKNRLYFMAANAKTGWKLSPTNKMPGNNSKATSVSLEKISRTLRKFDGDYNLEISDDNLFFIDRRNVI